MTQTGYRRSRESGQAIIMITLGITFLFALLGLVVDIGFGYFTKQLAQGAVDSAVMAGIATANAAGGTCGTTVLCQTGTVCAANPTNPPVTNFDSACLYAKVNGFPSTGNQTVTVSGGTGNPSSAPGVSSKYWMTVTATETIPVGFARVLGAGNETVSAQATATVSGSGGNGGCIYVLDASANQAMSISGNKTSITTNCGIYVNSNSSDALDVSGGATIKGSSVSVVGSYKANGGSTISPAPSTGGPAATDPLASLPAPSVGSCDHTNFSLSGGPGSLSPGVYCGGITISGGASASFGAGTYIINGGGFTVSGNSNVSGTGVFFYNTATAGYSYQPVVLSGGNSTSLSAPTSGTYKGVLFFDDRTISSSGQNSITGGTGANLSGTIYMPSQQLVFSGVSTSCALTVAIIAGTFTVSGSSYLAGDTTGNLTGLSSGYSSSLVQ